MSLEIVPYIDANPGFWSDWSQAVPLLLPAIGMAGGTHQVVDVLSGVVSGAFCLWLSQGSAAITEIVIYPRKRECNVFLAGGDLEEIRDWQRPDGPLEAWGFDVMECDRLAFAGRGGFGRALGGWDRSHVACIRERVSS